MHALADRIAKLVQILYCIKIEICSIIDQADCNSIQIFGLTESLESSNVCCPPNPNHLPTLVLLLKLIILLSIIVAVEMEEEQKAPPPYSSTPSGTNEAETTNKPHLDTDPNSYTQVQAETTVNIIYTQPHVLYPWPFLLERLSDSLLVGFALACLLHHIITTPFGQ